MMLKRLIAAVAAFWLAPAAAAATDPPPVTYPRLAASAAGPAGFTPTGWRIEHDVRGDLNGDGRADLVLVLRMADPGNVIANDGLGEDPFDTNPRILAVAVGEGGRFVLAAQNDSLIARREIPTLSDPLEQAPTISRGSLKVVLNLFMSAGGSDMGTMTYTFRLKDRRLVLIGYDDSMVQRMSGKMRSRSINYLTGRMRVGESDMGSDDEKVSWRRAPAPAPTIEAIGDGLAWNPDSRN